MTSEITDGSKAWREEVKHLFGLSWDRFVEWAIIVWLAAWIWTAWAVSNALVFPSSGPITWIAEVVTAFGETPATWLTDFPVWLADPNRAALLPISAVGAACFATLSVRSYRYTGLRVLALVCAVIAVQIEGSVLPLIWIVTISAVPFAVALGFGFLGDNKIHDEREWSIHYPPLAIRSFVLRVVGLFAMPVAAPILLLPALIGSYRWKHEYQPSEALATVAVREWEAARGGADDGSSGALHTAALLAGVTSTTSTARSQQAAAVFDDHLRDRQRQPLGARSLKSFVDSNR